MESKIKEILEKDYEYDFESDFFSDEIKVLMDEVVEATKKSLTTEIAELRKQLTWIPVEDYMPEEEQEVLFCHTKIKKPDGEMMKPTTSYGWYRKGYFYSYIGNERMMATHWFPIPQINNK